MANTSAIWQRAAHTTFYHLLAAQQKPHQEANSEQKKNEFWGKKSEEWTISRKMTRQKGAKELCRKNKFPALQ